MYGQRMRLFIAAWAVCMATAVTRVTAQPYCDVRTYTIHEGLSSNNLAAIRQTPNDLMWFATWNGLNCFDGYRFSTFRNTPGVSEVLSNNRLLQLEPSTTGNIWCTSYDRQLYLFDTNHCEFIDVSAMIQQKFQTSYRTWHIFPLANGATWVTSNDAPDTAFRLDDAAIARGEAAIESVPTGSGLTSVVLDSLGREWLLGQDGLTQYQGTLKSTTPYTLTEQLGTTVFFASADGRLSELTKGTKGLRTVALPASVRTISQLVPVGQERLLLATDAGVVSYDLSTRTCKLTSVQSPGQPSASVQAVYADSRGRLWAFTGSQGVTMVDTTGTTSCLQAQTANPAERTTCQQPLLHEDLHGTVWVVPTGGTFSYYDESQHRLVPYVLHSADRLGNRLSVITRYYIDHSGNFWFSGLHDVTLVNFRYRNFHFTPVANDETRALLLDSHGRLWAGAKTGELMVYGGKGTEPPLYLSPQGRLQSQPVVFGSNIYALAEDRQGRIWIGTKVTGLYLLTPDGRLTHFTHDDADPYSLVHNDIYDIDVDDAGHIWIGSYRGGLHLVSEQGGRIRFISSANELKQYPMTDGHEKIRRVTHTRGGVGLLSTNYGLITFQTDFKKPSDIKFYTNHHSVDDPSGLLANDVMQVLATRHGRIYVVTMGGGVQEIISEDLLQDRIRFSPIDIVEPGESAVLSVAEDGRGNLWMVREDDIHRFDIASEVTYEYGQGVIGESIELSEAKPIHDSISGNVYVAVNGGFLRFNAEEVTRQANQPRIVFTNVLYQGSRQQQPIFGLDRIDVPKESRNLTVYFSTLDYRNRDYVKYAYMLEGEDPSWTYIGTGNSVVLNNLSAGEHRLLVRSTNGEGVWIDNIQSLTINVESYFSETLLAHLLWVLLAVCLLAAAFWLGWRMAKKQEVVKNDRHWGCLRENT